MTLVGEDATVSAQIVTAVAEREDSTPVELPPLFDSIDPDALDALFEPTLSGRQRSGRIQFSYAGYGVTVEYDSNPTVTIDDARRQ